MQEIEVLDAPAKLAEFNEVERGLAELRSDLQGMQFDVTTTAGNAAARAARTRCVSTRTAADAAYEAWSKPMLAKQRSMRAELTRIKDEVRKVEEPIDAQIKAEEARRAEIKAAKDQAEREKQAEIQRKIDAIKAHAADAVGQSSTAIAELRASLDALSVSIDVYGERSGEALSAQLQTLAKLDELHASAASMEAEQARLAAERAELARLRAEQEARDRAAAAAQAEQERLAQAKRDAEQAAHRAEVARHQEAMKAQQAELDRQRQELQAQQDAIAKAGQDKRDAEAKAERDKQAAQRAAVEAAEKAAKNKADAEQRAAQAKAQAEREEAERRERIRFAANGPGDAEIVRVLTEHYAVSPSDVLLWLANFDHAVTMRRLAA